MADGFITAAKSASQPRRAFIAGALTVLVFFLLSSPLVTASTPDRGPRSAVIRTGERRGVRFNSGLTTCDEDLRNGRWVNRYWGSNGQIVPDIHLDGGRQQMDMLPIDAFKLEIERQELSGRWKWIGAEQSEVRNPDGPLVTVKRESTFRPIRVKIHTLLSGGLESGSWLPWVGAQTGRVVNETKIISGDRGESVWGHVGNVDL
jgi:hypothetical protein